MKRLIINADDLGLTEGINRGILQAHRAGVVSSATMMAAGRHFGSAVKPLRQAPGLSVGCHVVLTDGRPVLPSTKVGSLVPSGSQEFRRRLSDFVMRALGGKIDPDEVQAEAEAQFHKLQSAGIDVTHFDSHKHIHIFPNILRPLLRAARECGVKALRNPFAPVKPMAFAHLLRRAHLWTRYSQVRLLRRWEEEFRREVADAGMVTPDGTFGIVVTGTLDERLFEAIVGCVPEGTWELVCHPGYCDEELHKVGGLLKESREQELEVLTSPAARQILERHGVELISYTQLIEESDRKVAAGR